MVLYSILYSIFVLRKLDMCSPHPWDQHAGQNRHKKKDIKSFERVEHFKYLGTTLTNLSFIHEHSKSRLKSGNAYYHSEQNLLPSSSLPKDQNMQYWGKLMERDQLDYLGIIGKTWILKIFDGVAWTGLLWLRMGTGAGLL